MIGQVSGINHYTGKGRFKALASLIVLQKPFLFFHSKKYKSNCGYGLYRLKEVTLECEQSSQTGKHEI